MEVDFDPDLMLELSSHDALVLRYSFLSGASCTFVASSAAVMGCGVIVSIRSKGQNVLRVILETELDPELVLELSPPDILGVELYPP